MLALFISTSFAQTMRQKADKAYENRDYYNAVMLYQNLLEKAKDKNQKALFYYRIADSYKACVNYTSAIPWYEKAISNNYPDKKIFNDYGIMLMMSGDYTKAKEQFNITLASNPADSLAIIMVACCDYATKSLSDKVWFTVLNQEKVNSKYSDYGAALLNDTTLLFASSRIEAPMDRIYEFNSQAFSDFYISKLSQFDKVWKKAQKCSGSINTVFNDGSVFYNSKTKLAYFMQCNGIDGLEKKCGIYTSTYNPSTNNWTQSQAFEYQDSAYSTGHPTMNNAGDLMIFVSDMPNGIGGKDLWMMKKTNGKWGVPENMGSKFNTKGNEMFPFLMNDSILYFASNGWKGFGGLDLFSVNLNDKKQSEPTNLKYPFNSGADDFSIFFKNEKTGFFTSNRVGGIGDDDIYSFNAIPIVLFAKGEVKDKVTNELMANVYVTLKGSDGHIDSTMSDAKGRFVFKDLKVDVDYLVAVKKEGYLGDSKTFSTKGIKLSTLIAKSSGYDIDLLLDMVFVLQKITKEEIEIPDIFYDYDKAAIRESSKPELLKLVKILNENPDICIMINSHTDARGKAAYNKKLSEGRAKSCVTFLIENGIDPKRLKSTGWGSAKLKIVDAKTEEEHQINRRTTFQVTNAEQFKSIEQVRGLELKLQFSATKELLSNEILTRIRSYVPDKTIANVKELDGIYRYTVGSFKTFEEAQIYQDKLMQKGVESFVVAFFDGEKININEAKKIIEKK